MTLPFILLLLGACALGMTHAFEVDHMSAVSAFVARKPTPRHAAMFGIKWAIGHGLSLLIARLDFVLAAPDNLQRLGQFAGTISRRRPVRAGLVDADSNCAAVLSITRTTTIIHPTNWPSWPRRRCTRPNTHTHTPTAPRIRIRTIRLWMGMLHGAAGTAAFVGESVVAVSQSYWKVFAFTLAFSVGVLIAMGAYSAAFGGVLTLGERRSHTVISGVRALTGVWACAVGILLGFQVSAILVHWPYP